MKGLGILAATKKTAREKFFPNLWGNGGLGYAIDIGDLPEIVSYLRQRSSPLPTKLTHKLANFLDPARPPIKSGPKPGRSHSATRMKNEQIMHRYLTLRERPDLAWEYLGKKEFQRVREPIPDITVKHSEFAETLRKVIDQMFEDRKKATHLAYEPYATTDEVLLLSEVSKLKDMEPEWKYPDMERKRKTQKPPSCLEIKSHLCEAFRIGGRTFDEMLSCYKKMIAELYLEKIKFGDSPEEAKLRLCNRYRLLPESLDKILTKHKT